MTAASDNKGESLADRLRRLDRETADQAHALAQAGTPVPLPAGLGWVPMALLARWTLHGGPLRGQRFFVRFACDMLTPTLAAVRAHLEPDGPIAPDVDPFADPPPPRTARPRTGEPVLSAVVSAHNEENRLAACLGRLAFADEIVVVLDRCTDGTRAVADAYADTVVDGAWTVEGDRRNAAIEACCGAWVLEVDADEHVPEDLADEIRATVETSAFDAHEIPVDNMIGGTLVRRGWAASYGKAAYPGLFRRGVKTWGRQRVHPSLAWSGTRGMGPMLENRIVHHVDRGVADMIRRLNSYSDARARDHVDSGRIDSLANNVRRFVSRFRKCYVAREGRFEGGYGFLIALFAGLYPIVSYAKACEVRRAAGGTG